MLPGRVILPPVRIVPPGRVMPSGRMVPPGRVLSPGRMKVPPGRMTTTRSEATEDLSGRVMVSPGRGCLPSCQRWSPAHTPAESTSENWPSGGMMVPPWMMVPREYGALWEDGVIWGGDVL